MDAGAELQLRHGLDQELVQLGAALAVAPIADPDQIVGPLDLRQRMIQRDIGGFVPGEDPVGPAELQIDLPKHLAEGEHAVESVEIELRKLVGRADRTVMGIVKEQGEGRTLRPPAPDLRDQIGRIPFMHDDEIGAIKRPVEIEAGIVAADVDAGEERRDVVHGMTAAFADRVQPAPAVDGFEHDDLVPERMELARIATQEMRVAVVPAGGEGMIE